MAKGSFYAGAVVFQVQCAGPGLYSAPDGRPDASGA